VGFRPPVAKLTLLMQSHNSICDTLYALPKHHLASFYEAPAACVYEALRSILHAFELHAADPSMLEALSLSPHRSSPLLAKNLKAGFTHHRILPAATLVFTPSDMHRSLDHLGKICSKLQLLTPFQTPRYQDFSEASSRLLSPEMLLHCITPQPFSL